MWNSEHDIAGKLLEQSRDVIEQQYGTLFTEVRAGAYRALSGVSMHMGKKTALATQRLSKTAELDEQIFRRNATGQCDIDRFSMARARFFSLGCCVLNELSGLSAEECYRYLLVSKGETSQLQLIERIFHEKPEFRAAITQVHAARQQLKTVAFDMPSDPKESAAWRDKLFDAADRKETLERELAIALRGRFPDLSAVTPQDIQKHLPPKTAFLDFIHFTDLTAPPEGRGKLHRTRKLCVFVVRPDQPLQYFRLGPANIIEDAITEWRKALQDSAVQSASTIQKCAERVSQLIMAPLRSSIDGCEQILIAPDGPVCFLPFAALPGKAPGTYLIEDVTIGYATSARQSVELYARPKQDYQNRMLAVGNIQYEVQPRGVAKIAHAGRRGLLPEDAQWSDLPASRVEVEQIGELFTKVNGSANGLEILSGRPVELSELQSALQQRYRYFHFAGHGLFAEWDSVRLDQTPSFDETTFAYSTNSESIVLGRAPLLLSGLVLSRPVQSQHPAEAIMTADEVSNLDLRSTELVVLSACETGLGKTAAGEGVMGLQRAFLNAGARSVMASLWKVNDAATSLLMERFYLHLWSGNLSKWEALRQAQLDLLRHPEKLTDREILLTSRGIITGRTKPVPSNITSDQPSKHGAHPVLWSAFVLYGDGRL